MQYIDILYKLFSCLQLWMFKLMIYVFIYMHLISWFYATKVFKIRKLYVQTILSMWSKCSIPVPVVNLYSYGGQKLEYCTDYTCISVYLFSKFRVIWNSILLGLGWDLFCRCEEVVKVNLEVDMISPRRLLALSLHVCLIVGGEWKLSKSVFKNLFHGDYNSLCRCPNYERDRSLSLRPLILWRTSYSALIFVIREHDFQFMFLNKIYKAS